MQKYPKMIESYACILNMLVFMFLLAINFLISVGTCSTPKLPKQVRPLFNAYKAIQWVPTSAYLLRFITYAPSFILSGKLSLD